MALWGPEPSTPQKCNGVCAAQRPLFKPRVPFSGVTFQELKDGPFPGFLTHFWAVGKGSCSPDVILLCKISIFLSERGAGRTRRLCLVPRAVAPLRREVTGCAQPRA